MRVIPWMAVLAVLLPAYVAEAAETAVLTLSCNGAVTRLSLDGNDKPERVANMGLVVNLPEGTVTGFEYVAGVTIIGEVYVDFSGASGGWSMYGSIDRITGSMTTYTALRNSKTGALVHEREWNLICKPVKRLF
jgi:hypothetical protein